MSNYRQNGERSQYRQNGEGFFFRDTGREPPMFRRLLSAVKDERVKTLTLFRKPISVSKVLKFLQLNKSYDELFHLGIIINGKYLLDKSSVLNFEVSGVPHGSQVLYLPVTQIWTIGEMIDNVKAAIGPAKYTDYDSRTNNCQDFLLSLLNSNGLLTSAAQEFIKQDTEKIFASLPSYAGVISNLVTGAEAFINRQLQGEGSEKYLSFVN